MGFTRVPVPGWGDSSLSNSGFLITSLLCSPRCTGGGQWEEYLLATGARDQLCHAGLPADGHP